MAHYLIEVSYNNRGISDLVNNPQDRSTHVGSVIESLGGRLESFYNAFGDYDAVLLSLEQRAKHIPPVSDKLVSHQAS